MSPRARNTCSRLFYSTELVFRCKYKSWGQRCSIHPFLQERRRFSLFRPIKVQESTSNSVHDSSTLYRMIAEKQAPASIFQHIVENIDTVISSGLVETYLFQVLTSKNLNAVVSLTHILLGFHTTQYKLSNQFWSLLASKAASLGHHAAASLVYHEIVNPFLNHVSASITEENEHIPFLILPTTIEGLAIVFARNGNYIAVEGLRSYFKRFYSNFGHRDVYQTLCISKVESLAEAGFFQEALDAFFSLSVKYRGHLKRQDPKEASHSLKYASKINYKKRKQSISRNLSFDSLTNNGEKKHPNQFSPIVKFNDYNIEGGSYWAIFDGFLNVEDLPTFRTLLRERIEELTHQSESTVEQLWVFINKNHIAIGRFVVAGLCDLGFCREALAIVEKIASSTSNRKLAFTSAREYCRIFKALKIRLEKCSCRQEEHEIYEMIMETYASVERVFTNGSMPYICLRSFLESYFMSSFANIIEVAEIIQAWRFEGRTHITVNNDVYQRALSCGLRSSDLSDIIVAHC